MAKKKKKAGGGSAGAGRKPLTKKERLELIEKTMDKTKVMGVPVEGILSGKVKPELGIPAAGIIRLGPRAARTVINAAKSAVRGGSAGTQAAKATTKAVGKKAAKATGKRAAKKAARSRAKSASKAKPKTPAQEKARTPLRTQREIVGEGLKKDMTKRKVPTKLKSASEKAMEKTKPAEKAAAKKGAGRTPWPTPKGGPKPKQAMLKGVEDNLKGEIAKHYEALRNVRKGKDVGELGKNAEAEVKRIIGKIKRKEASLKRIRDIREGVEPGSRMSKVPKRARKGAPLPQGQEGEGKRKKKSKKKEKK